MALNPRRDIDESEMRTIAIKFELDKTTFGGLFLLQYGPKTEEM